MQMVVKRSQRAGGLMGNKVVFILDARAEPTNEEADLIKKYGLGKTVVYDSDARKAHQATALGHFDDVSGSPLMGANAKSLAGAAWSNMRGIASSAMMALSLRITVDSLIYGQHIECKDLDELLGAELAMVEACKSTKGYINVASTFDGREEVFEF